MSRFKNFLSGTLECSIKGQSPERFFNLCKSRRIELEHIRGEKQQILFSLTLDNYKRLRPIARKCHIVPHIAVRRGLPFILHKNRRHKFFFAGMAAAAVIIFILSRFIWNIEIDGNFSHTDTSIILFLREKGICTGRLKKNIDLDSLEEDLRLAYDDISWVSARIEGTVLKIQLEEGLVLTPPEDDENIPGNIVAVQSGKVSSIVTRTGTAQVQVGDEVQAGDILILGAVDIYNDDDTIKTTHYVHGDGDVYVEATYHCSDYYPGFYMEKNYMGSSVCVPGLELFGKLFTFGNFSFDEESNMENGSKLEVTSTVTKYRLTPNFYLPVRLYMTKIRPYETVPVKYTREAMEALGEEAIEQLLQNFEEADATVLDHNLSTVISDTGYSVTGDVEMIVPGGEFRPFLDVGARD